MKSILTPLLLIIGGLAIAHYLFGIDVEGLLEGFADFLGDLLDGPG